MKKENIKNIIFNVDRKYFHQIKNNTKDTINGIMVEYREYNNYWRKRLEARFYKGVEIRCGYPKNSDKDKILNFKWNGYQIQEIIHEKFNNKKTKVFAILLSNQDVSFMKEY